MLNVLVIGPQRMIALKDVSLVVNVFVVISRIEQILFVCVLVVTMEVSVSIIRNCLVSL
jgi:hypothetical protein